MFRTFSPAFRDAAAIRTRALHDGEGWTLTGQKQFISDALYSDFYIITARTDVEARARGISTFIVDRDAPGVTVNSDQPMMGLRGTTHGGLSFDQVALTPLNLLGEEGQGLKLAFDTLGRVRLAQVATRAG